MGEEVVLARKLLIFGLILALFAGLLPACGGGGGGGSGGESGGSSLSKEDIIVMLGDSLTRRTNWSALLPDNTVVNMGVDGDKTSGMLGRLGAALARNPKVLCIMGGINDFRTNFPVNTAYNNLASIVSQARAAGVRVIIQSTLYVARGYASAETINSKVSELNSRLSSLASSQGQRFLNLNSRLSSGGYLNDGYHDGGRLHLNGAAYQVWADLLKSVL